MTRTTAQREALHAARQLVAHAQKRAEALKRMKADPMIPNEGFSVLKAQHDAQTAWERQGLRAHTAQAIAHYRAESCVLPDYRPASAAHASWIAAIAAQAPHYSPLVMARTLKEAVAAGDMALVAAITPLAESYLGYRKEFQSGPVGGAVADARDALDHVPEAVAAREAAAWTDRLEAELHALDRINAEPDAPTALQLHIDMGAFPTLLAEESP